MLVSHCIIILILANSTFICLRNFGNIWRLIRRFSLQHGREGLHPPKVKSSAKVRLDYFVSTGGCECKYKLKGRYFSIWMRNPRGETAVCQRQDSNYFAGARPVACLAASRRTAPHPPPPHRNAASYNTNKFSPGLSSSDLLFGPSKVCFTGEKLTGSLHSI